MYVSDFLTPAANAHRDELIRDARRQRRAASGGKRRRLFSRARDVEARAVAQDRVAVGQWPAPARPELTVICGR